MTIDADAKTIADAKTRAHAKIFCQEVEIVSQHLGSP